MAVTDDVIDGTSVFGDAGREDVLHLLQQAARTVDAMWHAAQADRRNVEAVSLGEASYGIHRALIALQVDGALG